MVPFKNSQTPHKTNHDRESKEFHGNDSDANKNTICHNGNGHQRNAGQDFSDSIGSNRSRSFPKQRADHD